MKIFKPLFLSFFLLLISCNESMPDWLLESNHSMSPDGKAAIYSSALDDNRISIGTWVNTAIGSGGAGIFDIKTLDTSGVVLNWISDSIAQIEYPANSEIIRKADSSFFAGRVIKLNYKIKN